MKELSPEHFERILPLVKQSQMQSHLAFVYALLEGRHPGRIYVDDKDQPHTALVCNLTGFFFAFGQPEKELVWHVIAEWFAEPLSEEWSSLFATDQAWQDLLFDLMPLDTEPRKAFDLHERPSIDWRSRIPAGFSLQPIAIELAQSIIEGTDTSNLGIDPWFIRCAGGPAQYVGFLPGWALVDETQRAPGGLPQIASLCGYCAVGNGTVELEVGTVWEYRERGLATLVAAAYTEQCLAEGWRPAYSCSSDNLASIALAQRLGYTEVEEIIGFRLPRKGA